MNMDYCLSEALKFNSEGIPRSIWLYDIMCQFWKNLKKRFQGNPYLSLPEGLEVLRGIGLFHVHGHQDRCYGRFAPSFIPGAGMVDGEVLETLWAVLNGISDSIRSQSTAHRRETLDDHMNDSNWKKLILMGKCNTLSLHDVILNIPLSVNRLCKKFPTSVASAKASADDFQAISLSADPKMVEKWTNQEAEAQRNRDRDESAMDMFDVKMSKGLDYDMCCYIP